MRTSTCSPRFMGSAEPMVLVAFAYAISFVFICLARCLKDSK